MARAKLFFDFWNFQLDWNRALGKDDEDKPIRIPWANEIPKVVCEAIGRKLGEKVDYAGTHVYASVDPLGDAPLRRFLHSMESFPGYTVIVKERRSKLAGVRCTKCKAEIVTCPKCNEKLRRTVEKGVDAAIITDMIQMASDNVYDIGVLGSTDADLCPAASFIFQRLGKQIYNLWFQGRGHDLRNACFDHLKMAELFDELGVSS